MSDELGGGVGGEIGIEEGVGLLLLRGLLFGAGIGAGCICVACMGAGCLLDAAAAGLPVFLGAFFGVDASGVDVSPLADAAFFAFAMVDSFGITAAIVCASDVVTTPCGILRSGVPPGRWRLGS